jgi:SAM-dependent methyltransferase
MHRRRGMTTITDIAFEPDRELAELKEYLGDDYSQRDLERHKQGVEADLHDASSEAELYRTSRAYLYDLTVFAMSRTKLPYIADLMRFVPAGGRLLDYGCGIGSDGMLLIEQGYRVSFADFDNPSTRYLRWRLAHRGLSADIHDLDRDEVPRGFDLAYAFDVIEHIHDPFAFLAEMEARASLVIVNLLEPDPEDVEMHRDLPIKRILAHAARRDLVHYRRYHDGRSHLVLYGSRAAPLRRRARSLGLLAKGWRA